MTYLRLSLRYVLATISIIILSLALFFIIKEALAWTNPTSTPPGGSGTITVSGSNVGIGTIGPSYKLDVVSGGATTARFGTGSADTIVVGGGSGKITTGTIDPLYSIAGGRYATYLPGMIGQKEELTGTVNLQCDNDSCSSVLDFASASQGSDLWLFSQITDLGVDFNNLVVILSPSFDGKAWYEKDPNNARLIIYGGKNREVSYRLTAPRFDWQKWGNVSDEPHQGLVPYKQK